MDATGTTRPGTGPGAVRPAGPGTIAAIGEEVLLRGLGLAGVQVLPADQPEAVRAAWRGLPDPVALVILTPAAAAALAGRDCGGRLVAVLP
jgi:hypothetical protein